MHATATSSTPKTDYLNRRYKRPRFSVDRALTQPRHPDCAPWCNGTHRWRWNDPTCVTCPAGFVFGADERRLALFVRQDPGRPARLEMWATDGAGNVAVPLDRDQLDALIDRLTAARKLLDGGEVTS